MGVEQETTVRAFLTGLEGDQQDTAQIDRVLDHMSQDARYHVYAWKDPLVGHDAIRAELLRQAASFRDLRIKVVTIGSVGQTVFAERLDSMMINHKQVTFHVAGVFEMAPDGKIAAWRDYLDSREVAIKVGAPTSAGTSSIA